jgi:hypothetical protein
MHYGIGEPSTVMMIYSNKNKMKQEKIKTIRALRLFRQLKGIKK